MTKKLKCTVLLFLTSLAMAFKNRNRFTFTNVAFYICTINIIVTLALLIGYWNAPMVSAETLAQPIKQTIHKPVYIKINYPRINTMNAIAKCESGGRYDAQTFGGSAFGKYQITKDTWTDIKQAYKKQGLTLTILNPEHQELGANWLLDKRGLIPWSESKHCWSQIVGNNPSY